MIWAVSLATTDLITRSLTPVYGYMEFAVYLDSVTPDGPLVQTELYLHYPLHEASPKAFPFDYGSYHSQSDSRVWIYGIRSLSGFSNP